MIKELVRLVGWTFFPLAIVAKLPYAMTVVAVMTSVAAVRGSYAEAGTTAALVGVGTAVSGPLFGYIADRRGQRGLLVAAAVANGIAIYGLAWALRAEAPSGIVFLLGLLVGLSAPQASAMVRSRWLQAIARRVPEARRPKVTNSVLSYESMTDEFMFVIGPVVTGVIAMWLGVVVPLDFAAVLTAAGVVLFAVHPTVKYTRVRREAAKNGQAVPADASAERIEPLSSLFRLRVVLPADGMFCIGFFFGSTLPTLTDFLDTVGRGDATGVYYGIMGVGSAILALASAALPQTFSLRWRWIACAGVTLAGASILVSWHSLPGVVLALAVMGCGIGPSLVNLYSIAAVVGPAGRTTTLMASMATALVVGQAVASAVAGAVIDASGYAAGAWLSFAAIAALLLLGVANVYETAKLARVRLRVA